MRCEKPAAQSALGSGKERHLAWLLLLIRRVISPAWPRGSWRLMPARGSFTDVGYSRSLVTLCPGCPEDRRGPALHRAWNAEAVRLPGSARDWYAAPVVPFRRRG